MAWSPDLTWLQDLITKPSYGIWLIHQERINSIFLLFILKSYIPHYQLPSFLVTVTNTLLLLTSSLSNQLGYIFISNKLFLGKKSYVLLISRYQLSKMLKHKFIKITCKSTFFSILW